jgi:nucleotide-binding universal stress UspA family protein
MYKKILVAVDGSHASRRALDEAVRIAKATGGAVSAVSIVSHTSQLVDVSSGFAAAPENAAAGATTTAALEEAKTVFEQENVSGTTRAVDTYGEEIALVIQRVAAEEGADLIVMGTHGRSGMKRLLLGSVAESLLRVADRPVLLVRDDEGGK